MTLKPILVVVDFEATCWEGAPERRAEMEIIEVGAVQVDAASGDVHSSFQSFVQPVRNPSLSEFCKTLTSITQDQVDGAPKFPVVLAAFAEWLGDPAGALFCSWGDYDRKQLQRDCELHQVAFPFDGQHLNLKQAFAHWRNVAPAGIGYVLQTLDLVFEGTPHRGIDDARNIARIYARMVKLDYKL